MFYSIDTTAGKAVDEQLLSANKKFLSKVTVVTFDFCYSCEIMDFSPP